MPAAVKKPADHLPSKAEAKKQPIVVEYDGQTYSIDPDVYEDVEVLEVIGDAQTDQVLLPKAIRSIVGVADWNRFKDSARDENGRVSADKFGEFVAAVGEALGNRSASSGS